MHNVNVSFISKLTMPLPELERFYREQRKIQFAQGKKFGKIHIREIFYPVFRAFLIVDRLFRKQTIRIISPPLIYMERVIFACTHIGENDLENIYEKLGRGCWWFVGDPRFMILT